MVGAAGSTKAHNRIEYIPPISSIKFSVVFIDQSSQLRVILTTDWQDPLPTYDREGRVQIQIQHLWSYHTLAIQHFMFTCTITYITFSTGPFHISSVVKATGKPDGSRCTLGEYNIWYLVWWFGLLVVRLTQVPSSLLSCLLLCMFPSLTPVRIKKMVHWEAF